MNARAAVGAALAAALVVGIARQAAQGARATAASDAALERGDAREAIAEARLAAESLLPFVPYARRGQEQLARIAEGAEARGDDAIAGAAWRASRAAAMETRALGSGSEAWIARANAGLARAAAAHDAPHAAPATVIAPALAHETGPTSWETLLLGALGVAGAIGVARRLRGKRA